jgi:hypothetical protein
MTLDDLGRLLRAQGSKPRPTMPPKRHSSRFERWRRKIWRLMGISSG